MKAPREVYDRIYAQIDAMKLDQVLWFDPPFLPHHYCVWRRGKLNNFILCRRLVGNRIAVIRLQ